jgi:hypothetical protein
VRKARRVVFIAQMAVRNSARTATRSRHPTANLRQHKITLANTPQNTDAAICRMGNCMTMR